MTLSIIIVSYKVKEKLRDNLQALFSSLNAPDFEVFVVDNNSGDGTAEMVRAEFPAVQLIANPDNRGFARANNQALSLARGEYLLLLNPDMQVFPDTLEKAVAAAQKKPTAVVSGIKLVDEKGKIIPQIRRFPHFFDQLMIVLKIPHIFPRVLDAYLCRSFDYTQTAPVDSIRGAFFLISRTAWQEIFGKGKPSLDERYFIWFEEVDFCRQVKKKGGEVWYFPDASCLDYVGASFAQVALTAKQGYFRDSMLKYFRKWQPRWQSVLLALAWRFVSGAAKIIKK